MRFGEDDGPTLCPQCHADAWVQRRPSLPAGVVLWLGSGGPWRPGRSTCRVCGASGGGASWTMVFTGAAPSRWTLPLRVVRSVVRTVEGHRHLQPVPWVYLAAGLLGGVVGGVLGRSWRRLPATAIGAAGGGLLCWSGFAWTARSTPGLREDLLVAALEELSPERAAARRRRRDGALAGTAAFAVYGPVEGHAAGELADRRLHLSSEGRLVTSVALAHGDPGALTSPWVLVTSSIPGRSGAEHDEDTVADVMRQRVLETGADPTAVVATGWEEADLVVDGRAVPARLLRHGRYWSAVARVDDIQVVVDAHDVPVGLPLARVSDPAQRYT